MLMYLHVRKRPDHLPREDAVRLISHSAMGPESLPDEHLDLARARAHAQQGPCCGFCSLDGLAVFRCKCLRIAEGGSYGRVLLFVSLATGQAKPTYMDQPAAATHAIGTGQSREDGHSTYGAKAAQQHAQSWKGPSLFIRLGLVILTVAIQVRAAPHRDPRRRNGDGWFRGRTGNA